ncbi:MAG: ABC transporter ATP-binding protein [Candidatus Caldatribacteriota bacterium]|nr:ABC transporter ATP-binding protein [Candidatus Caldatribacteriota bacterium]
MIDTILKVNQIRCSYDKAPVIFDVSFEVKEKELVAMVGANGAGKSTIMKTIAGLMNPKSGTIIFRGKNISRLPAHMVLREGISYVPEGRRLFTKLSVRENLALGAYIEKDQKEIKRRQDEIFELFPILRERSTQIAETLSGGEQQMLAIARGMMSKPKLLMLDELSLGLMPALVEKVMDAVVNVNKNGMTVLLVEQMVQEALEIADRGYVVQTGKIVHSGKAQELLESNEVRKAYMGM